MVKLDELEAAVNRALQFGREGTYSPEWLTAKAIIRAAPVLLEIAKAALAYRSARERHAATGTIDAMDQVSLTWSALNATLSKVSP
jgi:hypothetical protein